MAKNISDQERQELNQRAQAVQAGWLASMANKKRESLTGDINHQRQAIARNVGALKGAKAFEIGETILAWRPVTFTMGDGNTLAPKVHQLQVKYIGNLIETQGAYWEPACCGYPDDETLWTPRQRLLVDSLCTAIGMVRV